jgi:hypothetical protein
VDILGPFPRAVGGDRYLFVAIDKFTKWPEATPVVNITQGAAVAFLKSIVCRLRTTDPIYKSDLLGVLRGHRHPALLRVRGPAQE